MDIPKNILHILHRIDEVSCDSAKVERLRSFFNFRHLVHFSYDGILYTPDLKSILGIRWKQSLPKLILLGEYAKRECSQEMDFREYDYRDLPPIEICQTSMRLQEYIGSVNLTKVHRESHQAISSLIKKAISIGLLCRPPFGNNYSFNNENPSDNFSKVYFFNNDILDFLKSTASQNKVKVKPYKKRKVRKSRKNDAEKIIVNDSEHHESTRSQGVSPSSSSLSCHTILSSCNIYSGISISATENDKKDAEPQSHQVKRTRNIAHKTPTKPIKSSAEIIGKIGTETLTFTQRVPTHLWSLGEKECNEMIKRYNPEITFYQQMSREDGMQFAVNQRRSKEGNVTKLSIRETNTFCLKRKIDREEELKESWKQYWYYDVNGSIYRILYFMNSGKWLKSDVDIYQLICPEKFNTKKNDRSVFKRMLMSVCFSPSADQSVTWIVRRLENGIRRGKIGMTEGEKLKEQSERVIRYLFKRLRDVVGRTVSNQVFYYESCIYMHLRRFLMERGYEVRQCYDAFYVDKELPQNMDEILQHCAEEYVSIRRKMGGVIPYDDESNRPLPESEVTNDEEMNALLMQMFDFDQFRAMIDGKFTQDVDELYEHKIE